jgi:hypothetical protein
MKIRSRISRSPNVTARDITNLQRAVLASTLPNERLRTWALEMLGRRNAVARWRGQPGCSVREVMQAISILYL